MEKIEEETCIRFEDRNQNQHQEIVSLIVYGLYGIRRYSTIFRISRTVNPLRPGTTWFRSVIVLNCLIDYQKIWRVYIWQNFNEKTTVVFTFIFPSV